MPILFTDSQAFKFPVSAKGIICFDNKFLLRKNERCEWELLGGKLEPHEDPKSCVIREFKEEAGIDIITYSIIDAWLYVLNKHIEVLILVYKCGAPNLPLPIDSPEGAELAWFSYNEISKLNMPEGYKKSINKYQAELLSLQQLKKL